MNWKERIYESLVEAKIVGVTRGPKKGIVSRTYKRGKSGSGQRTTVSVNPISGKLRRKSWKSGKAKTVLKSDPPMNVAQAAKKRSGIGWNP